MGLLDNENPIVVRNIAIENRLGAEVVATVRFRPGDGMLTLALSKQGAADDFTHFGLELPWLQTSTFPKD